MEKIVTLARSFFIMLLAAGIFTACTKSVAETDDEITGPKETVVLPMLDVNNNQVGSLYLDNMSGRAQARIAINDGHYTAGENMKANATLTTADGTTVYANCTDLDGNTGKCTTFPIRQLSNNIDATYIDVTGTQGLVFNIFDRDGNIVAKSAKHVIVIDN